MITKAALIRTLIAFFFSISAMAFGTGRFDAIADLKEKTNYHPPEILLRPDGGYIALWSEFIKKPMIIAGVQYDSSRYINFYRIVDATGRIVADRRILNFSLMPLKVYRYGLAVNAQNSIWMDSRKILIVGWEVAYGMDGYRPNRIVMTSSGEIVAGPDTAIHLGGSHEAIIVKATNGNIYIVDVTNRIQIMQVYPEFSEWKSISDAKLKAIYEKYDDYLPFNCQAVASLSHDKLLICSRTGWEHTSLKDRGNWLDFRPDKIHYALLDLEGNFITEPVKLDIVQSAFRVVPGIHLGGNYSDEDEQFDINRMKNASEDMDLSTLPNGEIILSVTAPANNGKLAVYQLKFNTDGKFISPDKTEIVNAKPFPKGVVLPVMKCVRAAVGGKDKWRSDLVVFGFDGEGNFYSERELWKEQHMK